MTIWRSLLRPWRAQPNPVATAPSKPGLDGYDYYAFISYSHRDRRLARRLHRRLESYVVPQRLRRDGNLPRTLFPIFLDQTGLNATGEGQDDLLHKLRRSKYLLVICSPDAARSKWVNWEIAHFKRLRAQDLANSATIPVTEPGDGSAYVVGLVTGGRPLASDRPGQASDECYPEAMRHRVDSQGNVTAARVEPFAPDHRPEADGPHHARLRLVACLLGIDIEGLRQRDQERRRRRIASATTVGTALAMVFCLMFAAAVKGYRLADQRGAEFRRALYHNSIALAEAEFNRNHLTAMRRILAACLNDRLRAYRDWEWFRLEYLSAQPNQTLSGHAATVNAIAVSADGRRLVSGDDAGVTHLWDVTPNTAGGGRDLGVLGSYTSRVLCVAFDLTGKRVATGYGDGTFRVWAIAPSRPTPGTLLIERRQRYPLYALAFHPDGRRLATASDIACLWDIDPASPHYGEARLPIPGHKRAVTALTFNRDGTRLITGSADETARVWDVETGEEVLYLNGLHLEGVSAVDVNAGGTYIVTASLDGTLKLWDADETYRIQLTRDGPGGALRRRKSADLMTFSGHDGDVLSAALSRDGLRIASGGLDSTVRIWDIASRREQTVLRGHTGPVTCVRYSPAAGDQRLFSAGGREIKIWAGDISAGTARVLIPHGDQVFAVAFSPRPGDERLVAATGGLSLWDAAAGRRVLDFGASNACLAAFSPDGTLIASADADGGMALWGADAGQPGTYGHCLRHLDGHARPINALAFSPAGQVLASASVDGIVHLWNVDPASHAFGTARPGAPPPRGSPVLALAYSPDGRHLALADETDAIQLWRLSRADGGARRERTLRVPADGAPLRVCALAYSPDGKHIAAGSWDGRIALWPATVGADEPDLPALIWPAHGGGITALVFMPGGRRLLSGSWDQTAKVWDFEAAHEMLALRAPLIVHAAYNPLTGQEEADDILLPNPINSVACSADGTCVAAAGRQLTLWDARAHGRL